MITAESLLAFARAEPFHAFRIVMQEGRICYVWQPRMISVGRDAFQLFHSDTDEEPFDSFEMLGLNYVERVELLKALPSPGF